MRRARGATDHVAGVDRHAIRTGPPRAARLATVNLHKRG
jgi:hypothetical protein